MNAHSDSIVGRFSGGNCSSGAAKENSLVELLARWLARVGGL